MTCTSHSSDQYFPSTSHSPHSVSVIFAPVRKLRDLEYPFSTFAKLSFFQAHFSSSPVNQSSFSNSRNLTTPGLRRCSTASELAHSPQLSPIGASDHTAKGLYIIALGIGTRIAFIMGNFLKAVKMLDSTGPHAL